VWHDLSDDDLVFPSQGNEYILKGSELLDRSPPPGKNCLPIIYSNSGFTRRKN